MKRANEQQLFICSTDRSDRKAFHSINKIITKGNFPSTVLRRYIHSQSHTPAINRLSPRIVRVFVVCKSNCESNQRSYFPLISFHHSSIDLAQKAPPWHVQTRFEYRYIQNRVDNRSSQHEFSCYHIEKVGGNHSQCQATHDDS